MSQAIIGNLRVDLGLNTAQFDAGAKKAQSSLAGLSNSIKGFAAGIAGALTLGGVATVLQTSINRMDELGKAAQKIGIPVEELSKLEYAARLADVPLANLETTMGRFARSLAEIETGGTNDAGAALQRLGINATNAQGQLRPTLDIMLDLADEFRDMPDGAQKSALAVQLFGKSGADMVPFLNQGRDAIKDATDEARAFGLEVSQNAARSAENFNDNLTRLKGAGEGLSQQLATQLVPALADVSEGLLSYLKDGNKIESGITSVKDWFAELQPFVETTRKEIEAITKALQYLGLVSEKTDLPPGLLDKALGGKVNLQASQADLDALLNSAGGGSGAKTGGGGGGKAGNGSTSSSPLQNSQLPPIFPPGTIDDIYGAGDALQSFSDQVRQSTSLTLGLTDGLASGLASSLTGIAFSAHSAGDAFEGLRQSAMNTLQSITDQLLNSGLNMLLGGLVPGGGLLGAQGLGNFGGFYANGGTLGAGKWGIAGEAGPEIIHGPARVTPMDRAGGGGVKVNIINQTGAKVTTESQRAPDGSVNIRALIQDEVVDTLGGGRAARVMGGRYGARIMPRRT